MKTCTFFGHNDTPESIRYELKQTLIELIENEDVDLFYVGNNGRFDSMVQSTLKLFKTVYTHIDYWVILAYIPSDKEDEIFNEDWDHTVYPFILEKIHPRYAIDKRNRWMVNESDYVITYVTHNWGGAAKFKEYAEKKKKIVINLAQSD